MENPQFGAAFQGKLSGRVPPPSSVRYILTPPVPISEVLLLQENEWSRVTGRKISIAILQVSL